jgi:putative hydrolase of the HAD superfamily
MIKSVFFDLGGTILHFRGADEKTLYVQGMRGVHQELIRRGYRVGDFEAFHRKIRRAVKVRTLLLFFSGRELRLDRILLRVLRRMKVRLKPGEIERLSEAWWKVYQPHLGCDDDVAGTLAALRKMGLKTGLISNTLWPAWILKEELRRRGHSKYFDVMLFSPEVGFRKPSRRIFRLALRQLKIKGREAAFVGDRLVEDVRGPQRVKMLTILKRRPAQKLRPTIRPNFIVDRLSEIPGIIEAVNTAAAKTR